MNIDAYLNRLNYDGSLTLNAETLSALQEAHLLTIPFENLSIHWDEPIVLDDEALFDKIVNRRRGGFCYELNGLFSALLDSLGFKVAKLSARVYVGEGNYNPEFDHMALVVSLEERWLVDVGFGATFRQPLRLDEPHEWTEEGASYRITPEGEQYTLFECKLGSKWQPQYRFTLKPYEYPDFQDRCDFHQYAPESHFRQGRVCTRTTPNGRITLSELTFIRTWLDGRREETELETEVEYLQILKEQFGLQFQE